METGLMIQLWALQYRVSNA